MKLYEDHVTAFASGKEFSRAEVEEILDTLKLYQERMAGFIECGERIFLIAGEMCGFNANDLYCKGPEETK